MQVKMLRDYYGQRAGMVVELGGGVGDLLIRRGFAELHKPKPKRPSGTKTRKLTNAKRSTAS